MRKQNYRNGALIGFNPAKHARDFQILRLNLGQICLRLNVDCKGQRGQFGLSTALSPRLVALHVCVLDYCKADPDPRKERGNQHTECQKGANARAFSRLNHVKAIVTDKYILWREAVVEEKIEKLLGME
uniref:Uncharacterized protein n=1 Tax=Strigamia maritima TaxID=126957 RepID=T1IVQ5_STRMM